MTLHVVGILLAARRARGVLRVEVLIVNGYTSAAEPCAVLLPPMLGPFGIALAGGISVHECASI